MARTAHRLWLAVVWLVATPWLSPFLLAQPTPPEEELYCLSFAGCGGVIDVDGQDALQDVEDYRRLSAQLLENPAAPNQEWYNLLHLRSAAKDSESFIADYLKDEHWQTDVESLDLGLSRLEWLDIWRRNQPQESSAWCAWATEKARIVGEAAAIAELESSLAADPGNRAIRGCLLRSLSRTGATSRIDELLAGQGPSPDLDQQYSFLPAEIRPLYDLTLNGSDYDQLLNILRTARLHDPENLLLELELYKYEYYEVSDERQEEISDRIDAIAQTDLALGHLASLCSDMQAYGKIDPESCWQRLTERVVAAGLHLDGAPIPEGLASRPYHWYSQLHQIRSELVTDAVNAGDRTVLRPLLKRGHVMGYGALWELAFDLAEADDPEEAASDISASEGTAEDAPLLSALQGSICDWLAESFHDGSLERPLFQSLGSCPHRVTEISQLLDACSLDEEKTRLEERQIAEITELPGHTLIAYDLPEPLLRAELERRLSLGDLDSQSRGLYEHHLTTLLLNANDREGLVIQGDRWLTHEGDLGPNLRQWLESVSSVPGVEIQVLRNLLKIRSNDRLLRLRLALEALSDGASRAAWPALEDAIALARNVAQDEEATVRERAEAHYVLGRLAVLEGRLGDATPHLAHFFELFLEHEVCPASAIACDRDYSLHLISAGDSDRLADYQKRRAQRAAERWAAAGPRAGEPGRFAPMILERLRLSIIHEDTLLQSLFLDQGCGLGPALHRLAVLASHHPEDTEIQRRLQRERARECHVWQENLQPWATAVSPLAGTLEMRESALLLSADYP